METFTGVLLVTANVGSLFDNVSRPVEIGLSPEHRRAARRSRLGEKGGAAGWRFRDVYLKCFMLACSLTTQQALRCSQSFIICNLQCFTDVFDALVGST